MAARVSGIVYGFQRVHAALQTGHVLTVQPVETSWILKGLSNAPVKKLMMVDGGADPTGDECDAQHWHGFIGMEREAVDQIAGWIRSPAN